MNNNAHTLPTVPVIDSYVPACTKELLQGVVNAAWEGNKEAQRKDAAWVAILHASSGDLIPQVCTTQMK